MNTIPQFIPPYQDKQMLCAHLGKSERTIDAWVKQGKLPPPKACGLWAWREVESCINRGGMSASEPLSPEEAIRAATEKAIQNVRRRA